MARKYDQALHKMKVNEYASAIVILSEIIKQSPYYFDAYLQRGLCYEEQKKYDLALSDYNEAIAKNPDFYQAYYQKALLLKNVKKNSKEAIDQLDKSINIKPTFNALVFRGDLHAEAKSYALAEKDYSQALQKQPSAEVYHSRARCYIGMDKSNEALDDFNMSIKLKNDNPQTYYERGLLYRSRAEYSAAIENISKAIELGLKTAESLEARADLYYNIMNYSAARTDYNDLIANFKVRVAENYAKRGVCFAALGDSVNAQKDFTRAIALDRNNHTIYIYRAENHLKRRRISSAMADYKKALELNSKAWDTYFSRGKAYLDLQKYELALSDFNVVIKRNPKHVEAYYLRGSCKDALKDFDGACQDLKMAAQLHHQQAKERIRTYCK